MADQASGNNEVHIAAEAEADRRQDPAGDRRSAVADREGHLRRVPRLRRADRAGAAERDPVDARLHHLQGKAELVTDLLPLLQEFHREKLAMLLRHQAGARLVGAVRRQQHLPVHHQPRRGAAHLGRRPRSPSSAATSPTPAEPSRTRRRARPTPRRRRSSRKTRRDAQALRRSLAAARRRDEQRPARQDAARDPRRDARAEALLRAGARRPHGSARPPRRSSSARRYGEVLPSRWIE